MDDVIVVGGGPTGFVNALGLARAGVQVRIIEAEPDIVSSPRAPVYHWSVLEGLESLGVLDDCIAAGFTKQDYTYLVKQTGETIAFDVKVLEGRVKHPYNLHLGQHLMAGVVRSHLERLDNATVEFGRRCLDIRQDDEGVTVVTDGDRGPAELRGRWVIGADGAASTVRTSLGLSFDGMTWPERFIATNVYYDFLKHGYAMVNFVIDARDGAVIAQIDRDGLWRCTYMEDAALPEDSYEARIPEAYERLLPGNDEYRLKASSPYRMHQRSASSYRAGRVLLAGDAAHATNPTGALGLTSGLFDSFALIPALSAVILDAADDRVLDRYSRSRKDIFETITSPQACRNKELVFHANGGGNKLEEGVAMLRRMRDDEDFRYERLMFTKKIESPPLL